MSNNNIENRQAIALIREDRRRILEVVTSKDHAVQLQYLQRKNLIRDDPPLCTSARCKDNPKQMKFSLVKNRGYCYRCMTCTTYKTWRENSFFEFFNIPIDQQLRLIYNFSMQHVQEDVLDVEQISRQTLISYNQHLRLACVADFDRDKIQFGGLGCIVEVDESLYIRVKHISIST